MQIAAVEKTLETAVPKETGMAVKEKTEDLAIPFAGLLEGLINLKLNKDGDQEQESGNLQVEALLTPHSMPAFFPAGLNMQLQDNDIPADRQENNVVTVCDMMDYSLKAEEGSMLQTDMRQEAADGEQIEVFPEVPESPVPGQRAEAKQGEIDTSRQVPADERISPEQNSENIEYAGLASGGKENMGKVRKQDGTETQGLKAPEIKVYENGGMVKADKQHVPEGKEEIPDGEHIEAGPDTVKHDNNKTGPHAILPGQSDALTKSHGITIQQTGHEDKTPDIINQVVDKMKIMLGSKKTEISIQLKPESLGRLKLRLTMTNGVLDGRIIVQNNQTKSIILSNIERLQESLEQQGIPVNKFNVNVGADGQYRQQQFFQDNRQSFRGRPEFSHYQQSEDEEPEIWRGEGTIELLA